MMEYTIAGYEFTTERELSREVRNYMRNWVRDSIWDIWDTEEFAEYETELRAFGELVDAQREQRWQAKMNAVTNLDEIKSLCVERRFEEAACRAAIAQAEQTKRIADRLDSLTDSIRGNAEEGTNTHYLRIDVVR